MNRIPIVFAFDNRLSLQAAVCVSSLLASAKPTTAYDIYVLHRRGQLLETDLLRKVVGCYPQTTLTLREVGDEFDTCFEVRGITTPAYYRLLIPRIIPEHDKVIYSDVDVVFRDDLSDIYSIDPADKYFVGVNALAHLDPDLNSYYKSLGLDPMNIIYSGNLLVNCRRFRNHPTKLDQMIAQSKNDYKFQDMDIINIVCCDEIGYTGPEFCLSTYIVNAMLFHSEAIEKIWSKSQIEKAKYKGLVHYNGRKPWEGYCINFDIWWEYYRKSPIFDEKFYFNFFNLRLNEYDRLPLMKRLKILFRYFVYGKEV